jgi:hypothetical protein
MVFKRDDGYYQYSIKIGDGLAEGIEWVEENLVGTRSGAAKMAVKWGLDAHESGEFNIENVELGGLQTQSGEQITLATKSEEHINRIEEFTEDFHSHHGTEHNSIAFRALVEAGLDNNPMND